MKWVVSWLFIICVVSACVSPQIESKPTPPEPDLELPEKDDIPDSVVIGSTLTPISATSSFTEVTGWYDDETIFYLEESHESSILYTHQLDTGKASPFFESEGWIVNVNSNNDFTIFAIQVMNEQNEATLFIVDRDGNKQMDIEGIGEDYSVFWNPYKQEQLIMTAYLPNWEFDVFFVDVQVGEITQIELGQTYFQWMTDTKVAYLKWSDSEPSYAAPLYEFDIKTEIEKKWQDEVIAYISFANQRSLAVTVDSIYELTSTYTFYQDSEPIRELEVPILNTYSEQWWIPFHAYDSEKDIFYYLRPKYSGDYISYKDGYELMAYHIESDSEELLTVIENHEPLSISPSGDYLLIGNRFEYVYDLSHQELVTIWEET